MNTSEQLSTHVLWFYFFNTLETLFILCHQFNHPVMCNSLRLHGLQHVRLLCPSPTLRACSDSCPSSPLCHPTISSSVIPFSSCLQSFPASESFLISFYLIPFLPKQTLIDFYYWGLRKINSGITTRKAKWKG